MVVETLPAGSLISELTLRGKRISGDLAEVLTEASCDLSMDKVGEVVLGFYDPKFDLLKSGMFDVGGRCDFDLLRQEIAIQSTDQAEDGLGLVKVTAWPVVVGALKRRRGAFVLRNASPSDFVIRECKAAGARYVVEPSAKRKTVSRDVKKEDPDDTTAPTPSSWTTFERLARELGYVLFEASGVVYFGSPTWLRFRAVTAARLTWKTGAGTDMIGTPTFERRAEGQEPRAASVSVPRSRIREFMPGARVSVAFPTYDGIYLVTALSFPIAGDGAAEVTIGQPENPKAEPPEKTDGSGKKRSAKDLKALAAKYRRGGAARRGAGARGAAYAPTVEEAVEYAASPPEAAPAAHTGADSTSVRGRSAVGDFVTLCLRQAVGHAVVGTLVADEGPGAFDGTELTSWAADHVGCFLPAGLVNQIAFLRARGEPLTVEEGLRERGALLWRPGAVAVSLGGGRGTIEATSRTYGVRSGAHAADWQGAARVPGLRYF